MLESITPQLPSVAIQGTAPIGVTRRLQRVMYAIAMNPDRFASMEEQIFLLTRAFQQRGGFFLPLFICSHVTGNPSVYESAELRAECLNLHRFRLETLWQLVRLIRRNRVDVVHWSFMEPLTNPYLWALTVLTPRVQHYFTDHTSRGLPLAPPAKGLKRVIKRYLYKRYSKVLGVSRFVTDHLREQGCSSNLFTCPYFLNTERFRPDSLVRDSVRASAGAAGSFIVIVVAYLVPAKGVDIAIKALAQLPAPIRLWVVGGGEESSRLQALCQELGVTERVRFFGHQPDVQRYLQAADCFVCPSRWGEAAALVNLEAQASGVPALGSHIGGIPEYIQDGKTGFLFPPEDDHTLTAQIRLLYTDPELRQTMQRDARAWVVETFSVESRMQTFLDIYSTP